jgi:putative transposase
MKLLITFAKFNKKSLAAARSPLPGAGQHRRELMPELLATAHSSADAFPVTRVCQVLGLSRATYYRWQVARPRPDRDMELRAQVQGIALEMPAYGYRRITHALRRRDVAVNHKRVLRVMREDNLLCLRKRPFVRTTDSAHPFTVYPNLLPELTVTSLDQLWVADITYIRLQREFVYLAVLLDAYSRRCIGWALKRHLEAELAVAALQMALATRPIRPGLVHHSDRGVQYASQAYTNLLQAQGIRISMSRTGNPYDNAQAESFIKTLKYEEVHLFEYQNFAEAHGRIGQFIEEVYNEKRLHSALGYRPPTEFEQLLGS